MNIQGVNILSQRIIFGPIWQGIAAWIIAMCLTFFFALIWSDGQKWTGLIYWVCLALFIICIALTFFKDGKTIFNRPSKIEYTIEITDNNVWKELGLNYTIKEKPYETKEIYIIEGDYINDNT